MIRHALTFGVLGLLIAVSGLVTGGVGLSWLADPWIVGVGVMILFAYAAGEFLKGLGLPALLGYILVGIVLGPSFASLMPASYPLGVVTDEVIDRLDLIHVLIVGVIGMLAGAKVRVRELAGNLRLLLAITGAILLLVVPSTMAAVLFAAQLFPELLPFLSEGPVTTQVSIALLFGVLAFGLSPSITVALLQELRARGPLATVILGVVVLGEFVLFALFALVLTVVRTLVGPDTLSFGVVTGVLPGVAWELLLSTVLGVALGLLSAAFLRYVRKETLLFVLAALMLGYFGVEAGSAEPLLTFLVAGFFIQNASQQGDHLVRMLERIALPVFVVYFVVVAAGIDLAGTLSYLPLVAMLIVTRVASLYFGVRWASQKAVDANHTYEYLRTAFISQDAVVLVLAGVVVGYFPEWGAEFQSVVIASVIAYLIAGPIFLKVGLERSGETRTSRQPLLTDPSVAAETELEVVDIEVALKSPSFEDSWLRGHVEDLREGLVALSEEAFFNAATDQHGALHESLQKIDALVERQLQELGDLAREAKSESYERRVAQRVAELQAEYARQMQPVIQKIEATPGAAVTAENLERFLTGLSELEDRDSLYRIEREEELHMPAEDDGPLILALKLGRRGRHKVMGRGYRTVPVGRLWRYYVDLAVPIALLKTAPQVVVHYETFWKRLWRQLRSLDEFWDTLTQELGQVPDDDQEQRVELAHRLRQRVDAFAEEFQREQAELRQATERTVPLVLQQLAGPVVSSYDSFLEGLKRAGTSQLAPFRYRPSSRYGPSRRAESRLLDRLQRQQGIVDGYKGWIRLDHEVSSFEQWIRLFRARIDEAAISTLGISWWANVEDLAEVCESVDLKDSEEGMEVCEAFYAEDLRPRVAQLRRQQEELLARIHKGSATRSLQVRLEARISRMPQQVAVLAGEPERVVLTSAGSHFDLPLRHWISSQVGREVALRIVEFNERCEARIEERLALLSSVDQLLELNLVTAHRDPDEGQAEQAPVEVAREGVKRASRMLRGFLEDTAEQSQEVGGWLQDELNQIVTKAFSPIAERRLSEIQRELTRLEAASFVARGESWLGDALEPVLRRVRALRSRGATAAAELGDEIRSVLVEGGEDVDRFEIRRLLYAGEQASASQAPTIYRRLFVPMPLDIPEFYRSRGGPEEQLTATVKDFFEGAEHSVLVTAAPGMGKRTFVQHLIPGRLQALVSGLTEDRIHRVSMMLWPRTEEGISDRLSRELLGRGGVRSFADLSRRLRRSGRERAVVVVEQSERVFLRTEEGLQRARRFFEMVEDTSDKVLWVVLMGQGAATFLETQLDLEAHFTHREKLAPMNAAELEEMIMSRHGVSGFELEFRPPHLRRLERLRRPVVGAQVRQIPRQVFFERLEVLSGGNPRTALLYWLKALQPDSLEESRIWVEPLPDRDVGLLGPLPLRQRLILAQICVHRTMSCGELARVLGESEATVRRALRHLQRLGFVAPVPDTEDDFALRSMASARVERDLTLLNLV